MFFRVEIVFSLFGEIDNGLIDGDVIDILISCCCSGFIDSSGFVFSVLRCVNFVFRNKSNNVFKKIWDWWCEERFVF